MDRKKGSDSNAYLDMTSSRMVSRCCRMERKKGSDSNAYLDMTSSRMVSRCCRMERKKGSDSNAYLDMTSSRMVSRCCRMERKKGSDREPSVVLYLDRSKHSRVSLVSKRCKESSRHSAIFCFASLPSTISVEV